VHLVRWQAEHLGDPVARKMRLLRAGPQGGATGPRINDCAGRTLLACDWKGHRCSEVESGRFARIPFIN